jgi:hypothetical protein
MSKIESRVGVIKESEERIYTVLSDYNTLVEQAEKMNF